MDNSVIVSLRDIVVEFDGQRILDGLNLDIHDKEFVTLLGSSGCGKTTTLRLIAGFLEPNSGKVLLKGEDITGVPRPRDAGGEKEPPRRRAESATEGPEHPADRTGAGSGLRPGGRR